MATRRSGGRPAEGTRLPKIGPAEAGLLTTIRHTAAILAGALSLAVLYGWAFDRDELIRPAMGFSATNPMSAVGFFLTACALTLDPRRHIVVVRILAGLVITIALARFAELIGDLPHGVSQWLFAEKLSRARADNGFGVTAASLLLLGVATLVSASRRRNLVLVAQIGCIGVILVTLFVAVGYALEHLGLGGALLVTIPLYSAPVLLALATAALCLNADTGVMRAILNRGSTGTLVRSALPFILFALVLIGTEDGSLPLLLINLAATVSLIGGGIVALYRGDRLRCDRELAMEQSEGRYRHAEQVGHVGHWRMDSASGAFRWSDEVYEILGLPRSAKPSLEQKFAVTHPDDRDEAREVITRAIRDGRGWEVDHRVVRADGEVRHIKSHGVCEKDEAGDVTAIFSVIADITELQLARHEAEAATATKTAFLANMSHEIRTPMNGVLGFIELLMDSELELNQRRHLILVQELAHALLKLLNDILELSKIEASQLALSVEPSNIRHDITHCVRMMTPIAEQKGLKLRATFADSFPASVLIDSLRLRQILFNLIGNAVKFTHEGSVAVTLGETPVCNGKRGILIKVSDTGIGIGEDRKAGIFGAFEQADASVSRRFGGTGLGLSISRSLAGLMGGTLSLDSRENDGTVVTLVLPLDEVFAPALADVVHPLLKRDVTLRRVEPMTRPVSILLVEDIDINQALITEMLVRLGHKVELATNGSEALARCRSLSVSPGLWDIILMDVQMPVMDGMTATRAIRALGGRAATIPIIALTANAFAAEMQDCRNAGMNDHVAKPAGFAQLKQAIELWSNLAASPVPASGFRELDTVSVADRFEARMRKSNNRLISLAMELLEASAAQRARLLHEAGGIAHVLAGTAAMFRQAPLGEVARQVEGELNAIALQHGAGTLGTGYGSIGRLISALAIAIDPQDRCSPEGIDPAMDRRS